MATPVPNKLHLHGSDEGTRPQGCLMNGSEMETTWGAFWITLAIETKLGGGYQNLSEALR
jgi:hypothetical protein